jgi:hypothetical protein
LLATGLAVAAAGSLATAGALNVVQHRTTVLVLTRSIDVGTTITAADLTTADVAVPPGVAVVPAGQRASLAGKTALANLPVGALLAPGAIGDPEPPARGQSLIVLALPPSRIPVSGLHPGQHLVLASAAGTWPATTDPGTADGSAGASGTAAVAAGAGPIATADAIVVRVGTPAVGATTTPVDVAVHLADGPLWAGLAASGRVTVLVEPQGQVQS